MSYRVIHYFTDMQDKGFEYKAGDSFPRLGKTVTDARLKELSTSMNRQKKPLIKFVEDKVVEKELELPFVTVGQKHTKTEINRMPLAELKKLATEKGVDGADSMSGAELKKALIELFEL